MLSATATKSGPACAAERCTGPGPAYYVTSFNPAEVVRTPVGTTTLTFSNGNAAALFSYSVDGIAQNEIDNALSVRAAGRTLCH